MSITPIEWTQQTETGEPAENALTPQSVTDAINEQLGDVLDRVLEVPEGYTGVEIPWGPTVTGKYLRWGSGGTSIIAGTPSGGGGGGSTTALDTIADLTALDSSALTPGDLVYVKSRDGIGTWGGGWFIWDDLCTDATDGGVTFVPDDLVAVATSEQIPYGPTDTPIEHYALAHSQVVWGSVAMTYKDETATIGSEWLHGHGTTSRNGTYTPATFHPSLDHATGYVWGDYIGKLAAIVNSNTNTGASYSTRHTTISYSYCTGPGRWKRILSGGFVTPQMFGAQPNDETFDCSHAICWAINYVTNNQPTINTLWYDEGTCWVYGFWGEVTSNLTQRGNGPGHCIVKYRGQQIVGGGTGGAKGGGVIDFLRAEYFAKDGNGFPTSTDPYRLMEVYRTGQVQFDAATGMSFQDGYVDGNIDNNMYFRNDTGQVAWTRSQVSQFLRESLFYSGFFITNESQRQYVAGMKWYASNFGWINLGGSGHAGVGAGYLQGDNLRFGPSLSGRCLYGGQGQVSNIFISGYTRSSYCSPTTGLWTNLRVDITQTNPWPESPDFDRFPVVMGARLTSREAQTSVDLADERYGAHGLSVRGFTLSCLSTADALIQWEGEGLTVDGLIMEGPSQSQLFTFLQRQTSNYASGVPQASSGPKFGGGKFWSRGMNGVTVVQDTTGLIEDGLISGLHVIETYAEPSALTYSHDLTNAAWTKTGITSTTHTGESHDELDRDEYSRLVEDTGNTIHAVERTVSTTSGKTYVFDASVTTSSGRDCYLYISGIGYCFINHTTGVVGYTDTGLTVLPVFDPETYIWRFGVKYKETATGTRTIRFGMANGTAAIANATYTGDGTSYLIGGALHFREHRFFKYALMQANVVVNGSADAGKQPNSMVGITQRGRGMVGDLTCDVGATAAQGLYAPQQKLVFQDVNVEPLVGHILKLTGVEQANCVPSVFIFDGCSFNVTTNEWFTTDVHNHLGSAVNLTIKMTNTKIDTWDPNYSVIAGGNTTFQNVLKKVILGGCYTTDGRVSEFEQIVTITMGTEVSAATFNASGYLFTTPLMWAPMSYGVQPISAKAIACAPTVAVEITGGNYSTPGLRVTPTVNATNGDVLTFRLHGAVAPSRAL